MAYYNGKYEDLSAVASRDYVIQMIQYTIDGGEFPPSGGNVDPPDGGGTDDPTPPNLSEYAKLASPHFIGIPTTPKPATTSLDQITNVQYISEQLSDYPTTDDMETAIQEALIGGDVDLDDYATKVYVGEEIAKIPLPDMSDYATQDDLTAKANIVSPFFAGTPTVPTPTGTSVPGAIANVAYVDSRIAELAPPENLSSYAKLDSPSFFGIPRAPLPTGIDNNQLSTVLYVKNSVQDLVTESELQNSITILDNQTDGKITSISESTNAQLLLKADLASPEFTGTPTVPTPTGNANKNAIVSIGYLENNPQETNPSQVITGENAYTVPGSVFSDGPGVHYLFIGAGDADVNIEAVAANKIGTAHPRVTFTNNKGTSIALQFPLTGMTFLNDEGASRYTSTIPGSSVTIMAIGNYFVIVAESGTWQYNQ